MASIAGTTVLRFIGRVQRATGQTLERDTRLGLDGVMYRQAGKKAATVSSIRTMTSLANAAAAASQYATFMALKGTAITTIDEHAITETNVIVHDVRLVEMKTVLAASDGNTVLATYEWDLEATATS